MIGLSFRAVLFISERKENFVLAKKLPGGNPRLTDRPSAPKAPIVEGNPRPLIAPANEGPRKEPEDALRLIIAGGNPPALGGRPFQEDRYLYNLNLFKRSIALQFLQECEWLFDPFAPQVSQEVFTKHTLIAEKQQVCGGLFVPAELYCGQFNGAYIVSDLEQIVGSWRCISIYNGFIRQHIFDCIVNYLSNFGLSVIVIDFYSVEFLQRIQLIEKRNNQIALHSRYEFVGMMIEFAFSVGEAQIAKRKMSGKHIECGKHMASVFFGNIGVFVFSVYQWTRMKRNALKALLVEGEFVLVYSLLNAITLVVEDEGDQVEIRRLSKITGFVNENREFFHRAASNLDIKNAGGKTPALGSRPFRIDHILYTTTQGVLSSHNYTRTHVLKHQVNAWGGECCGC